MSHLKHYQKHKNFIDYSIIMCECKICVKFEHNFFIDLKVDCFIC